MFSQRAVGLFLVLVCLACPCARGQVVERIRPGRSFRSDVRGLIGQPQSVEELGQTTVERTEARDEGLADVLAAYDGLGLLTWARLRFVNELPPDVAAAFFDLRGEETLVDGNPFRPGGDGFEATHHFHDDGVHFAVRDGVVDEVWLAIPGADPAALGAAIPASILAEATDDPAIPAAPAPDPVDRQPPPPATGNPPGYLGVVASDLAPAIADDLGVPPGAGLLVLGVMESGPADRAGLLPEDVLLSVDGSRMAMMAQLQRAMSETEAGQVVRVELIRDGRTERVELELGSAPAAGSPRRPPLGGHHPCWLGVRVESMAGRAARGAPPPVSEGVIVTGVKPGGAADRSGLREGDIIVEFGGWPVLRSMSLARLTAGSAPGERVKMLVVRGARELELEAQMQRVPDADGGRLTESVDLPDWGLVLRTLNPATAEHLGVGQSHGVHVDSVHARSPAAEAGLAAGDIILQARGYPALAVRVIESAGVGPTLRLTGRRGDRPFVALLVRD